ncbi:hypothetical protein ACFYNA_15495 [Streptomyces sp. NPDC006640]|uniref:hypothetical protein n=1 Tax=Streptomyces sp. NPDC006640 TaxID=3364754 RepID=UPI0036CDA275
MTDSQTLPDPQGPEYTPCACSHIEPEHEPNAGACLSCDCEAYRPAAAPVPAPAPTGQAADAPAAECSAQHRQFDDGRHCIRAAQHQGDHIDERGYHWSDTVAIYPVADGTFRTGVNVRAELRRLADAASGPGSADGETQQDETQARRGDAVEAWLKAQRDAAADHPEAYQAADGLLDVYRLHADTGTPLGEHVCEGRTVGDCDCLEQPAAVSQPGKEA